jgi:CRP-like cAMP-binding protein
LIDLPRSTVIEPENASPDYVYFLEGALASVLAVTPDGSQIEAGLYSFDGMSGSCVVHGVGHGPLRTLIQVPGAAQRISSNRLKEAMASSPSMLATFLRWHQVFAVQVAHTALSNGRHTVERRLARWLLMCQDRLGDEVNITHEFLAIMLGVRRAGVTTAIHILEGRRLIKATRGHVRITDRAGLKALAGDAYGAPEAYHEHVWGRQIPDVVVSREAVPA